MVDQWCERGSNFTGIFISQYTHDRERTSALRRRALTQMFSKHTCRGLVMSNIENPLHRAWNNLKATRQPHLGQGLTDCGLAQYKPGIQGFDSRYRGRSVSILNGAREHRGRQVIE